MSLSHSAVKNEYLQILSKKGAKLFFDKTVVLLVILLILHHYNSNIEISNLRIFVKVNTFAAIICHIPFLKEK